MRKGGTDSESAGVETLCKVDLWGRGCHGCRWVDCGAVWCMFVVVVVVGCGAGVVRDGSGQHRYHPRLHYYEYLFSAFLHKAIRDTDNTLPKKLVPPQTCGGHRPPRSVPSSNNRPVLCRGPCSGRASSSSSFILSHKTHVILRYAFATLPSIATHAMASLVSPAPEEIAAASYVGFDCACALVPVARKTLMLTLCATLGQLPSVSYHSADRA